MLATYLPLITLTLLGDAPAEAALPAQATFDPVALFQRLPHWAQVATLVWGAVLVAASLAADFLDRYAKALMTRGEKVPAWLEAVGGTTHFLALNLRKGTKLLGGAWGRKS